MGMSWLPRAAATKATRTRTVAVRLASRLRHAELPVGDRQALVDDRHHPVDFFPRDDQRWSNLNGHEHPGKQPALCHELGDSTAERVLRSCGPPPERLFRRLILNELHSAEETEAAHISDGRMPAQPVELLEQVFSLLSAALREMLALQDLDVLQRRRAGDGLPAKGEQVRE